MESLQFPHVLTYFETSPLQKSRGRHSRAVIPGEGTRISRLRIIFWKFSDFPPIPAKDCPEELFMVLSWRGMLQFFHTKTCGKHEHVCIHACTHVHVTCACSESSTQTPASSIFLSSVPLFGFRCCDQ